MMETAIQAGPEMDRAVAAALGLTLAAVCDGETMPYGDHWRCRHCHYIGYWGEDWHPEHPRPYSSDWGDAMRVAETCGLLKTGMFSQEADGSWSYTFQISHTRPLIPTQRAATGPRVLCAAILARAQP